MKNDTRKRIAAAILIACLAAALFAACGGALSKPNNGTYRSEDNLQSWTFTGSNEITLSFGGLLSTDGTYEIDDDEMLITTTGLLASTSSYTITEITAESFFIDGTKFIKQ
jgi:hypothetical protein